MPHYKAPCRHGLHCILPPYLLDFLSHCTDVTAEVDVNAWLATTRRQSNKLRLERMGFHPGPRMPAVAATASQGKTRKIYDAQNLGASRICYTQRPGS
jgi:hypothetical protein